MDRGTSGVCNRKRSDDVEGDFSETTKYCSKILISFLTLSVAPLFLQKDSSPVVRPRGFPGTTTQV
jgi:hypothetical protein